MVNIKDIDLNAVGANRVSIIYYEIESYGNLIYDSPLCLIFNDLYAYFLSIDGEINLIFASLKDKNKDILDYYYFITIL